MSAQRQRKTVAELDYIAREVRARLEFAKKHADKAAALELSAGAMLVDAWPHFQTARDAEHWALTKIGVHRSWAYELMARHTRPGELTGKQQADARRHAKPAEPTAKATSPRARTSQPTEKPETSSAKPQGKRNDTPINLPRSRIVSTWTDAEWALALRTIQSFRGETK